MTLNKSNKLNKIKKKRAWELDFLRGICIIMVVVDHIMLDISEFFGYNWSASGHEGLAKAYEVADFYMTSDIRASIWIIFIFLFFFVSGACTSFSRNNLLRGIKLAVVALLLTLGSYLMEVVLQTSGLMILFGVLHCMASCILLYSLLDFFIKLINKKNNRGIKAGILLLAAAVVLIINHYCNIPIMDISKNLRLPSGTLLKGIFVFVRDLGVLTSDYFPLLPYLGFFLIGAAFGTIFYPKKESLLPKLDGKWHYPVTIPGRFSLIIYIISQILIIAICALISYAILGDLLL